MEVEWTQRAEIEFEKYVNFIAKNVSYKASADFMEQVYDTIQKISNPLVNYQLVDENKGIRKCKISKYYDLYYRILNDEIIELITFFDSRQNPKKLKL